MLLRFLPFALLLLLCLPMLEIAASIWLAHLIGWYLLLWLLASAAVGVLLLKSWRLTSAWALMGSLQRGEVPISRLFWVARSLVAGLLFIFPGPVSDVFALLLLLPWPAGKTIRFDGQGSTQQNPGDEILEGEFQRVDDIAGHIPQDRRQSRGSTP